MSNNQYTASAGSLVLTFNSNALSNPITLEGFAEDSFDVQNAEALVRTIGTDGKVKNSIKPVIIKGSLKLFAGSPSKTAINSILASQVSTQVPLVGSLLITNPSTGDTDTLNNFTWIDAPVIAGASVDGMKDVTFNFSYCASTSTINNQLVNKLIESARSIIGF